MGESTPAIDEQPKDLATEPATPVANDMSDTLAEWHAYECRDWYGTYRACIIEKIPDGTERAAALDALNATVAPWAEHMEMGDEGALMVDGDCEYAAQTWKQETEALGCESWTFEEYVQPKVAPATGFPMLSTGMTECDEPFNKYVRCMLGRLAESQRQWQYEAFEREAKELQESARDPEFRKAWVHNCTVNNGAMYGDMAKLAGCDW